MAGTQLSLSPVCQCLKTEIGSPPVGRWVRPKRYDLWQNILPQPRNAPVTGEIDPKEYRYWQIQTAVDDYLEARRGTRPSNQTGEEPENLSPLGRQDFRPVPRWSARTRQTGAKRNASQDEGPTRKFHRVAPEDAGVQEQPQEPLVRSDHRGIDSPAGAATNAGQREDFQAYLEGLDEFMAGLE